MNITMLKSKIHRAVVTQAELNYVGSITVDSELLKAAGILEYELVQIVDIEMVIVSRHTPYPESRDQELCASTVLLPVRSRSEITSFSCATHQ